MDRLVPVVPYWRSSCGGACLSQGGVSVDHIVLNPELRVLAIRVMEDVMRSANADLSARGQPETSAITQSFLDLMFHLTDNMGPYMSSTVLDFLAFQPMEGEETSCRAMGFQSRLSIPGPALRSPALSLSLHVRWCAGGCLGMAVDYMFSKPLERAMTNGVHCPYMEFVVRTVQGIKILREKGKMKPPPTSL